MHSKVYTDYGRVFQATTGQTDMVVKKELHVL